MTADKASQKFSKYGDILLSQQEADEILRPTRLLILEGNQLLAYLILTNFILSLVVKLFFFCFAGYFRVQLHILIP